ncbi:MAG: cytochrome c oxidase accessory protein CcoG [Planctomycetota bacterium]|nr:cytochrome c oxidase accessory protein CcoG [Planctomycetota bacterium]
METETLPLTPPDQVLSTLNPDGTRRWLAPRLSKGRFWRRRRVLGYFLMVLFNVLPWIQIGGKPAMRLDVLQREFTFFGVAFQPTETVLVVALFLTAFLGIFLLTALFGRVWCGWACPQTVYLEFLYRPLERLIEGKAYSKGPDAVSKGRKLLKLLVFFLVSLHLSHTFLAYFVGPHTVLEWSLGSPTEHPGGFAMVWFVTLLMLIDFASFREQMCTLACPYGRLQSALVDPNSIVIGYDTTRGEPRGKGKRGTEKTAALGDCIDCKLCVAVCPTGIDIRDGLQMECVNCAECIDACDSVMDRIGLDRGLVRYASENELAGGERKVVRVRTVLYSVGLVVAFVTLLFFLGSRKDTLVSVLRIRNVPFMTLADGRISNPVKLRIENRAPEARTYSVTPTQAGYLTMPESLSIEVGPGGTEELIFNVLVDASVFVGGQAPLELVVGDGAGFQTSLERTLLGPR